jgi:hypothetical protein
MYDSAVVFLYARQTSRAPFGASGPSDSGKDSRRFNSTAIWASSSRVATAPTVLSSAGPHLEGHKLVCFETRCEDFLGQILGKFRVPFRVCQGALEKSDRSSEVGRVASAMGGSSEMRLKGCTCQLSVVPS